jgi:2-polyprenyl-3-methyl-5-hydroxy-6-metoxy-1,4-benzoquinol methylase
MKNDLGESVSKTLDGNKKILPYLPELLQDLWSMGSPPERSIELLEPLCLPAGRTKALDLGCGKGAISINLARHLGYRVTGVDGCEEFLEAARIKAREFGVESLCEFVLGDIRDFVNQARGFDIVILASVGDVLGGPRDTIGRLRECVKPEGLILIDDGFLKGREKYHHFKPHDETLFELLSFGDGLVREVINSDEEVKEINESYFRDISKRARLLIKRKPSLRRLLEDYLRTQETECELMNRNFRGATWLIRRIEPRPPRSEDQQKRISAADGPADDL